MNTLLETREKLEKVFAALATPTSYRGYMAMGMRLKTLNIVAAGDSVFVPDRDVEFLTVQDVPAFHWRFATGMIRLGCVRKTSFRFGMPGLIPEGTTQSYDLGHYPPEDYDLAAAFAALEVSAVSAAATHRKDWQNARGTFVAEFTPHLQQPVCLFGDKQTRRIAPASEWMPQPYLAFSSSLRHLWRLCLVSGVPSKEIQSRFRQDLRTGLQALSPCNGVVKTVRYDKVFRGQLPVMEIEIVATDKRLWSVRMLRTTRTAVGVGDEVTRGGVVGYMCPPIPAAWFASKAEPLPVLDDSVLCQAFGDESTLALVLELWFENRKLRLKPGFVHLPAAMAYPASLAACDAEMVWDLQKAQDYGNDSLLTFPAFFLHGWNDFRFTLGEVDVDLTPGSGMYVRTKRSPIFRKPVLAPHE